MNDNYVTGKNRLALERELKTQGVAYNVYTKLVEIQMMANQKKPPMQIAQQLGVRIEDVLAAFTTLGIEYDKARTPDIRKVREKMMPPQKK